MKKLMLTLLSIGVIGLMSWNGPITPSELIDKDLPYLLAFYKTRHQEPEISLQEKETAKALAGELRQIGFDVTEDFGGYGIVGILKNGDGPMILYRTDMDALPMAEKTGLPYTSKRVPGEGQDGAMHACGHDMHMTTWLGTARALANMKDQWKGTLMLIGQPAEEIGAGAKLMIDNGLYQTFGVPDYAIGLHCSPTIPAGQVGFGKGYTMANTEKITINVFGKGAHGASPHMSIDPVVIASMIVMDLQTIVSRNIKPTDAAVVTVGVFQSGTAYNIIPDGAKLELTVRTYSEETRQYVHKRIKEICRGVAMGAGLPEDKMPEVIIPDVFTPANYNDPELMDDLVTSAQKAIGEAAVVAAEPLMIGEDFSRYGLTPEDVPAVLYWLGTAPQARIESGDLPGLHSPFYYPDPEVSIKTGVSVTTQGLLDLFNGE
ncbi:MAG: amidohydrolase [Saprospiraceae bacterium]|nr:amidohydrolase [Lewinella sp.]